jgi:hypothetical protein
MFKSLKRKPKIVLGNINLEPKEKIRIKNNVDSQLFVTRVDGRT